MWVSPSGSTDCFLRPDFIWDHAEREVSFNSTITSRAVFFYYLAIQGSVWRDIKFAVFVVVFCLFVCTVEDISTQDRAIGVKFWLRVEQTPGTGTR